MKRILTIIVIAILGITSANAARQTEYVIRGKVLDAGSNEPVGWATVALMTADSTLVAGIACDENGAYELKAAPGSYTLTASIIGYKDHSQPVTLKTASIDMEPIFLEPDTQMLSGATLTERVKLVEMKIDKVVVNVSQSAFAQGSNALELMKKAPGVTIDKDGNVKLNGKAVSVWIDGRPSYVDGKTLEALLRSTNSESIEKFELMEHPSAKYDAEGQGGIVNIKTKRNLIHGFNGSLGIGGGGMKFNDIAAPNWNQSSWLNLSYRNSKINSYFNVYEGVENSPVRIINDLNAPSSSFRQLGVTELMNKQFDYNVKFGTDWFIDSNNTLGFIVFVPGSSSSFNSMSSKTELYQGGALTQTATADIKNGPSRMTQANVNLNYTHVFDEKRGAEMTANLDYYHNISNDANSQVDTSYFINLPGQSFISRKSMNTNQFCDIYSVKADYQSVVAKKYMLEAGAKWALSHTDNNSIETQTLSADRLTYFIYNEHVAAAYASLAGQLGQKVSFKLGLRGEYTNSFGDWRSSSTQTRRSYFDLFPTVYVGYQPSEKVRLSLSYTRRLNRPRYWQLNPTKTYVDAKTYLLGNPDILPQYDNSLSLSSGFGQYLSLGIGYNHSSNIVNQVPSFDPDGTQYLTWSNIGTQNIGFASLSVAALPVSKWLLWTFNAAALQINSTSSQSGTVRNCFGVQAYTDFTFLLPKDWKIELDAVYNSPLTIACYKTHTVWNSSIAVKKNMLDNRLILTLGLDDIFRSNSNDIDIYDENSKDTFTALQQKLYSQRLSINITWNFGRAQKPVKQRNVGNLEEMSRVGSGSSN